MEGSIFTEENGIITLNTDALRLCPKLKDLRADLVEYLILVYDQFDSPLWKKPLEERKRLASRKLWGSKDYDPELNGDITKGQISEIKALTYSPQAATIDVYRNKIKYLNDQLFSELDTVKIQRITQTIEQLQQMLSDLEKSFNKTKELMTIKGGKSLSYLELKQRQQREYIKNTR